MKLSVIIPYYEAPMMLQIHMDHLEARGIPDGVEYLFVDDGSQKHPITEPLPHGRTFRIKQNIAWNVAGARNLGAHEANGEWLLFADIDRIIPQEVFDVPVLPQHFYQFQDHMWWGAPRTRRVTPDSIDVEVVLSPGTTLVRKDRFWEAGGHKEGGAVGCYGGTDRGLRKRMARVGLTMKVHPIPIICYNRISLDGEVSTWARDWTGGDKQTKTEGTLRFDWEELT
jgi:glycosyltransferase involved in cell wall biosynthesis